MEKDFAKFQEQQEAWEKQIEMFEKYVPKIYELMVDYGLCYEHPEKVMVKDVMFIIRRAFTGSTTILNDFCFHFKHRIKNSPEEFEKLWINKEAKE